MPETNALPAVAVRRSPFEGPPPPEATAPSEVVAKRLMVGVSYVVALRLRPKELRHGTEPLLRLGRGVALRLGIRRLNVSP